MAASTIEVLAPPAKQECRDCGETFPYDADADRCPSCVAEQFGEEADDGR